VLYWTFAPWHIFGFAIALSPFRGNRASHSPRPLVCTAVTLV
jgi:hypothetical protein